MIGIEYNRIDYRLVVVSLMHGNNKTEGLGNHLQRPQLDLPGDR